MALVYMNSNEAVAGADWSSHTHSCVHAISEVPPTNGERSIQITWSNEQCFHHATWTCPSVHLPLTTRAVAALEDGALTNEHQVYELYACALYKAPPTPRSNSKQF